MTIAYIGLGSNLNDPIAQLHSARSAIRALTDTQELACSSLFRSMPMGPSDQPDYVNAVMAVETGLPPNELLARLQTIEHAQGRVRNGLRWGPRTLDLDILLYGDQVIATDTLTVPHAGLAEREFVLYPMAEIAPPDLQIPNAGKLSDLLIACPRRGLTAITDG
jgi:2-amino-4-hydroxy-6-hydroxymethyldihydropteridine diphosphokinase